MSELSKEIENLKERLDKMKEYKYNLYKDLIKADTIILQLERELNEKCIHKKEKDTSYYPAEWVCVYCGM